MTAFDALERSASELQERIDGHQRLLNSLLAKSTEGARLDKGISVDCPHQHMLKRTLIDTIRVLEETRKAFKSKQLEALRKKLIGILAKEA